MIFQWCTSSVFLNMFIKKHKYILKQSYTNTVLQAAYFIQQYIKHFPILVNVLAIQLLMITQNFISRFSCIYHKLKLNDLNKIRSPRVCCLQLIWLFICHHDRILFFSLSSQYMNSVLNVTYKPRWQLGPQQSIFQEG